MTDERGLTSAAPDVAGSFADWNLTYQQLRETVIAAALSWHTVHRLQLLPEASGGEIGLRARLIIEADQLLDDAVIGLLAAGRETSGPCSVNAIEEKTRPHE